MSSLLSNAELNSIINDVRTIITDDTIGTSISYYKFSGVSAADYIPNIGNLPAMYSISSVSAFKGGYKPDEIFKSGGSIEVTDIKFIIMRDDVSGILSVDDKIVELGSNYQSRTTYEVKAISRDPLAICYFFQCRVL
jgi:hypothetical protein